VGLLGEWELPDVVSSLVEVVVFRFREDHPEYLLMRRSPGQRVYPNVWQFVTGKVRKGERGTEAALREVREETGFTPLHFWVVPFVNSFFDPLADSIALVPTFACQVHPHEDPILSAEHNSFEWLPREPALQRLVWPGGKGALEVVHRSILGGDKAGILTRLDP